jgi:peptidoglycan/LPS O-acetylase OafA/YrhL
LLSYGVSRFFRIAPLFYLLVLATWLYAFRRFGIRHGWDEIALSVTFLFNLVPGCETGVVRASWTVGVEMLFYLVFPFLFMWQASWGRRAGMLCAAVAMSIVFNHAMDRLTTAPQTRASFEYFSFFGICRRSCWGCWLMISIGASDWQPSVYVSLGRSSVSALADWRPWRRCRAALGYSRQQLGFATPLSLSE